MGKAKRFFLSQFRPRRPTKKLHLRQTVLRSEEMLRRRPPRQLPPRPRALPLGPFPLALLFLPFLWASVSATQFLRTKTRIDQCIADKGSGGCGPAGKCVPFPHGSRCQCTIGWMGTECQRPCQDIYNSCDRWLQEGRCIWTRTFSAFFLDNCPLTCGICQRASGQKSLPIPLPPMLEPLAWFVGRWQTQTIGHYSDRFPAPLSRGPYTEILDVQLAEVPSFDRPPLNISVTARTLDGWDEHNEVGFLTVKPAHEDNGFMEEVGRTPHGRDMVALELVSNTGIMTIEEGEVFGPGVLSMSTRWHREFQPRIDEMGDRIQLETVRRSFRALDKNTLEERLEFTLRGQPEKRRKVAKKFRRTHDYLMA